MAQTDGNNESFSVTLQHIGDEIQDMLDSVAGFIKDGIDDLTWSINDIFETTGDDLSSAGNDMKQDIENLAHSTSSYFTAVGDVIAFRFQKLKALTELRKAGAKIEDATGLDLSELYTTVKEAFKNAGGKFSDEVKVAQNVNEVESAIKNLQDLAM